MNGPSRLGEENMGLLSMNCIKRVGTLRTVTAHETDGGLSRDKITHRVRSQMMWEHGMHENPKWRPKAQLDPHLSV